MRRYFLFTRKDEANANLAARKSCLDMAIQEENNAQLICEEALPVKQQEENIYQQLLQKGFTKRDIHAALHKCMLFEIEEKKKKATHKKNLPNTKTFLFYKASHYLKNFTGKALSFLKTQFAKKPKNPV